MEATLFPLRNEGIRLLSYIDDYLICSSSREQAGKDAEMVLNHFSSLGFRINMIKSSPHNRQNIWGSSYLGLSYRVTEERVAFFTQCVARFQMGKVVPFRLCSRMLGLMASVISVVHLELLSMRDFQRWIFTALTQTG